MRLATTAALLAMAALCSPGSPAAAQGLDLHIGVGAAVPTGDFGDFAKVGYTVQGGAMLPLGDTPVDLRGDLALSGFSAKDYDGRDRLITVLAGPQLAITRTGLSPYVNARVGYASIKYTEDAPSGGESYSESGSGFAWGVGAGVVIPAGPLSLTFDAGVVKVPGSSEYEDSKTTLPLVAGVRVPLR